MDVEKTKFAVMLPCHGGWYDRIALSLWLLDYVLHFISFFAFIPQSVLASYLNVCCLYSLWCDIFNPMRYGVFIIPALWSYFLQRILLIPQCYNVVFISHLRCTNSLMCVVFNPWYMLSSFLCPCFLLPKYILHYFQNLSYYTMYKCMSYHTIIILKHPSCHTIFKHVSPDTTFKHVIIHYPQTPVISHHLQTYVMSLLLQKHVMWHHLQTRVMWHHFQTPALSHNLRTHVMSPPSNTCTFTHLQYMWCHTTFKHLCQIIYKIQY